VKELTNPPAWPSRWVAVPQEVREVQVVRRSRIRVSMEGRRRRRKVQSPER